MTLKEFYAAVGGDYDATIRRIPKESMVLRFVKKYADDKTYAQLTEAVGKQDWETAFRASHTLKGAAQNLGFDGLYRAAFALTEEMRGACERLVEIAREKGILVSFDPNIRRELSADAAARARLLWAVRHADVVAPTLSEGQMITGETSIGGVLRALHAMGPRVVALTRDKDGAVLSRGGEVAVAAGIDEEPVDPTGAGDTLAAALCVGLQEDMPLARLAAFCNCAGTLVIKKKGAIGMALPERGQVDAMVASGVCRVECMPLESLV